MIHYFDHTGQWQVLSSEELEAVEMTGRSSWRDYKRTPTDYALHERLADTLPNKPVFNMKGFREFSIMMRKQRPARHIRPWHYSDKKTLIRLRNNGCPWLVIAKVLERTEGGCQQMLFRIRDDQSRGLLSYLPTALSESEIDPQ